MGLIIGCNSNFKKSGGGESDYPLPPEKQYYTITTSELENGIHFSDLHTDPGTYIWDQFKDDYFRSMEWVRFRFVPEKNTGILGLENLRWSYLMICEGDDIFNGNYTGGSDNDIQPDDYLFEAGHVYNILIQKSDNHPWTGTLTAEYPEDIHVTNREQVNAIFIGSGLMQNGKPLRLTRARENTILWMDCVIFNYGDTIFFGAFGDKYYNGAFAIRNEGDKLYVGLSNVQNYHDFGEAIPWQIPVSVRLSQDEGIMEVINLKHNNQIRYYNFTQNVNWTRGNFNQPIQLFGFNVGGNSVKMTNFSGLICSTIKLKGWEGVNEWRDIWPCQFTMSNGTIKYGFHNDQTGQDYVLRGAMDASSLWDQFIDSTNDFSKFFANIESDGRLVFTANDYKGDYIGEIPFIYRKDGNYYRVNIYPDYNEETKQYQNTGTRKTVEELNQNTIDTNNYFILSYFDENLLWLDNWPNNWESFEGVPPLSQENFEPIRNNQAWEFREVSDEPEIASVEHVDAVFIGSGLDINNQPINIGQAADENTTMWMDCVVNTQGDGVDNDARFFGAWDLNYQNGAFAIRNEGDKLYVGLSNFGNSNDFGEAIPLGIPVTVKLSQKDGEMSVTDMRNNDVLRYFDFKQNESWTRSNCNQPIQLFGFNEGGDSGKMTPNNGLLVSTITLDKPELGIGPVGWPSKFTLADGSIKYGFENQLTHQYYILKDGSDGTTEWNNYRNSGSEQSPEPNTTVASDEVN